jgi:hypothetical protein
MTDTPTVVVGRAYQRRATLELAGEMLTWRAQRGDLELVAENIVTTIRDVRTVRWIVRRWSMAGLVLAGLSVLWMFSESPTFGVCVLAIASAIIALRLTRPRRWLVVELDGHRLALRVSSDAAGGARALASRIEQMRLTEPCAKPLPLP